MNNQYVILGIAETATDNEIRKALKSQIDKNCGRDSNGKNADGDYLQSIFLQAAKDLLDPKKRAKIDVELQEQRLKSGVVPFVEKDSKGKEEEIRFNQGTLFGKLEDTEVEHILKYVRTSLLEDKIDFEKEDIHHSQLIEMEALKTPWICRDYAKSTPTTETYFILYIDNENKCIEAHDKKYSYGVGDHQGHSLRNLFGEELCWFDEDKSQILQQSLSVIEINEERVLCLRASSFYPYRCISYQMRTNIVFALCRLMRKNPNFVRDIVERHTDYVQKQKMLSSNK